MNIIYIGFMGCGKTSTGRFLSEKSGMELVDLDDLIIEKAGLSIPEIFEQIGEKAFRDLETYCIKLISKKKNTIISTGGGVVLRQENRDLLRKSGMVIWLKTTPKNVIKFTSNNKDRPKLQGKSEIDVKKMMQERESFYKECAHYSIDSYKSSLQAITQETLDYLKLFESLKKN